MRSVPDPIERPAEGRRLSDCARVVLQGLGHRTELVSLELSEARDAMLASGLRLFVSGALFLLSAMVFTVFVALLLWDTPRKLQVLFTIAVTYLLSGAGLLVWGLRKIRVFQPFPETGGQLKQDTACIEELLQER